MTDRHEPLSSDEMLEQFRREVESDRAERSAPRATPPPAPPTVARATPASEVPAVEPRGRPARRPAPPTTRPPGHPVQRRAVIVAAISLGLIVFGLISALLSFPQ
jgi:hypothetical protein